MVLIRCGYGEFSLDYSFPENQIDREAAPGDRANLVLGIDGESDSFFEAVQGVRGSGRVTFSTPAEMWLDKISRANKSMFLGLVTEEPHRAGNMSAFSAKGSTAAIADLRVACKGR
jgi:hypothetical protein